MREDRITARLREEMAPVRVTSALRSRTLGAMRGKEGTIVRKKISMALVFALIGVLLCGAALAAAGRAGMLDFIGRYANTYIPQDASDYMQKDVASFEPGTAVTAAVRELYYDGRTARVTVDVTPADEKTLLMGMDTWIDEDSWQDLITLTWSEADESDTRTVADVFRQEGYAQAFNVSISCHEAATGAIAGGSGDFVLGSDGVLTVFGEWDFDDDVAQREVVLNVALERYEAGADGTPVRTGETDRYEFPLTLTSASRNGGESAEVYVNEAPVLYEEIGVRVDRVTIEVKPLELYATVDMTVVDEALFAKTDDGLWFEFIDPDSTQQEPWAQRLASGLSGGGGVRPLDDARYRQCETLALNELRDTYTLRAFECWNKTRFDTHTFAMRPATAEEIEETRASSPDADI